VKRGRDPVAQPPGAGARPRPGLTAGSCPPARSASPVRAGCCSRMASGELLLKLSASAALVADQRLSRPVRGRAVARREQVQQGFALIGSGAGQRERDWPAVERADQVPSQSPEVARVAGAAGCWSRAAPARRRTGAGGGHERAAATGLRRRGRAPPASPAAVMRSALLSFRVMPAAASAQVAGSPSADRRSSRKARSRGSPALSSPADAGLPRRSTAGPGRITGPDPSAMMFR
jgi:hypothetical protein